MKFEEAVKFYINGNEDFNFCYYDENRKTIYLTDILHPNHNYNRIKKYLLLKLGKVKITKKYKRNKWAHNLLLTFKN